MSQRSSTRCWLWRRGSDPAWILASKAPTRPEGLIFGGSARVAGEARPHVRSHPVGVEWWRLGGPKVSTGPGALDAPREAGGKLVVTTKSDFTEDEWRRIVRAPFVAGMAISLADPGGPIEATKETMATLKTATSPPSREQLLAEVALEIQAMVQAEAESPVRVPAHGGRGPPRRAGARGAARRAGGGRGQGRHPRRSRLSGVGWLLLRRRPPRPPRKAVSWGSARCRSVSAKRRCWTRCARQFQDDLLRGVVVELWGCSRRGQGPPRLVSG